MKRPSAAVLVVFGGLSLLYLGSFFDSPLSPVQGDGHYQWLWARSLVYDGDLALGNDYRLCGDPWQLAQRTPPGRAPGNYWAPGPAVIWAPLLLVARGLHPMSGDGGALGAACRGPVAQVGVFGTVVAALAALLLAWRLARRYVGEGPALAATAGVAVASPLPYYACFLPSYGHAPTAFAVALVLERWDATRGSRSAWRWTGLGALVGFAMLMRPQSGVVVIGPLAEWIGLAREDVRTRDTRRMARHVGIGAAFVLGLVAVFSVQMVLWRQMYGHIFALPQGGGFLRWDWPAIDGVLFGASGGLLTWNPLLYLSFAGLLMAPFRRETRFTGAVCLAVVAATTYINSVAWDWWGAVSFSNRRFTLLVAPFVLGMAWVFHGIVRWAVRNPRGAGAGVAALVLGLAGAWNFAAMRGVGTFHIHSWREAPWEQRWNAIFHELSGSVWNSVGNPFAWPVSLPFAAIYQTHPRRYDAMRGMGMFFTGHDEVPAPRPGEDKAVLPKRLRRLYLADGFAEEPRKVRGKRAMVTTTPRTRMLIPFFIDDVAQLKVLWTAVPDKDESPGGKRGAGKPDPNRDKSKGKGGRDAPSEARVVLRWNGRRITQLEVPDHWKVSRIDLPEGTVREGINDIRWRIEGPPVAFRWLQGVPDKKNAK